MFSKFLGMAKAAVRKDMAVQPVIPASGVKAGRSAEEAAALANQFGDRSRVTYKDIVAKKVSINPTHRNEYLSAAEWAEWKELTSFIPATIRVGGGMYRSLTVTKSNLASLRASVANAKKAEAETLTRLAGEFFNACVEAGVDVTAQGFEVSELSLKAQKMAIAESRRVFVYALKVAEQARLEQAGYEVWLDQGLVVANGSIQTREASAQSATRRGKEAHMEAAAARRNAGYLVWQDGVNQVKTEITVIVEEKQLVQSVTEVKAELEVTKESYLAAHAAMTKLSEENEDSEVADDVWEGAQQKLEVAEAAYIASHKKYVMAKKWGGVFKIVPTTTVRVLEAFQGWGAQSRKDYSKQVMLLEIEAIKRSTRK